MKTSQIKRSKILHPFLISIFPILILYSQNIGRINTADLVLPLILSIVFSISLYYIVKIILKNSNKSAIIISIILIILFSYGHIYYLLTYSMKTDQYIMIYIINLYQTQKIFGQKLQIESHGLKNGIKFENMIL